MSGFELTVGVSDCDRMRPLLDGTVKIEGVSASFQLMPVQALFNQQLTEHTFDCCEFPLATFLRTLETPARPYVAVPIFPSRHFRMSCVFVNRKAGIRRPADLAGRRIGVPVFDMAAAVWLRGMFQDYYGLNRLDPVYVTGGLEQGRVGDEHPQYYPPTFRIEHVPQALAQLLESGEIDALYTARAPSTFRPGTNVVRLFDDPKAEDIAYFRKSGIFPPMHTLCVKRSVFERAPDIGRRLFTAFRQAQNVAMERLFDSSALSVMLPWLVEHLFETQRELGADYWSSGFAANRATLATLISYMRADELISTSFTPEDLFEDKDLLLT